MKASLEVKSTSKVAGKNMTKPKKELKVFQNTPLLQPGETQKLQS